MIADLLSLVTWLSPLSLLSRLNAHRRLHEGEEAPGPFPSAWTLRPFGPPRGTLDKDIWSDVRVDLSTDLWAQRREYLKEDDITPFMAPNPLRKEFILGGLIGKGYVADENVSPSPALVDLIEQ